jgi:uncharacterized protein (TIGR02391 family)
MTSQKLDLTLLTKLSKKTGKDVTYLRKRICEKASQLGISSAAYLILWAKKLKIGTLRVERKIGKSSPQILEDIRRSIPYFLTPPKISEDRHEKRVQKISYPSLRLAIESLIEDEILKNRCKDLLRAKKYFDRVFREATTILEDRIRKISNINARGADLVAKALNPDPDKAVIKVSNKKHEQEGIFNLSKGVILAFRDPTHHEISDQFNEKDAIKFLCIIDFLLTILKSASK